MKMAYAMKCRYLGNLSFILLLLFSNPLLYAKENPTDKSIAIFAGGCFWCMQPPYDKTPGVLSTSVGYTGGKTKNPTYTNVTGQQSGHYEAIKIVYDPNVISYDKLLSLYWVNIDPFDTTGQFCDKGSSYKSAIFYVTDAQKIKALSTKNLVEKLFKQDVTTKVLPFTTFYPAEDYHQSFYKKSPVRYKLYRYNCGRDKRLKNLWQNMPNIFK